METNLLPLSNRFREELTEAQKQFYTILVESPAATFGDAELIEGFKPRLYLNRDGTVTWGSPEDGHTKTHGHSMTIEGVIEAVKTVLMAEIAHKKPTWASKDADDNYTVPFIPYGVEKDTEVPCIVYRVLDGKPGAFGKGEPNSPNTRARRPILREVTSDPTDPDYEAFIFSRRLDYNIEICACAGKSHEANRLRSLIEDTLSTSLWYFRHSGIQQFLFEEQLADRYETHEAVNLFYRPLKYYVAIDKLSWKSAAVLKNLVTTITLE